MVKAGPRVLGTLFPRPAGKEEGGHMTKGKILFLVSANGQVVYRGCPTMDERGISTFLGLALSRLWWRYGGRRYKVFVQWEGKGLLRLGIFSTVLCLWRFLPFCTTGYRLSG